MTMKIVNLSCPFCGAPLDANGLEEIVTCEHCGKTVFLDDEDEKGEDFPFGIDDPEEFGYQFEKGRQRAREEKELEDKGSQWLPTYYRSNPYSDYGQQSESQATNEKKETPPADAVGCIKWIGYILLWICFFPFMWFYWIITTDRFSKFTKILLLLISVVAMAFGCWLGDDK